LKERNLEGGGRSSGDSEGATSKKGAGLRVNSWGIFNGNWLGGGKKEGKREEGIDPWMDGGKTDYTKGSQLSDVTREENRNGGGE